MSEPQTGTGGQRPATCSRCNSPATESEFVGLYQGASAWTLDRHDAPCGAPCIGGGISSDHMRDGETSLRDVLNRAHPKHCGCLGGLVRRGWVVSYDHPIWGPCRGLVLVSDREEDGRSGHAFVQNLAVTNGPREWRPVGELTRVLLPGDKPNWEPWHWTALGELAAATQTLSDLAQQCHEIRKGDVGPVSAELQAEYSAACTAVRNLLVRS